MHLSPILTLLTFTTCVGHGLSAPTEPAEHGEPAPAELAERGEAAAGELEKRSTWRARFCIDPQRNGIGNGPHKFQNCYEDSGTIGVCVSHKPHDILNDAITAYTLLDPPPEQSDYILWVYAGENCPDPNGSDPEAKICINQNVELDLTDQVINDRITSYTVRPAH